MKTLLICVALIGMGWGQAELAMKSGEFSQVDVPAIETREHTGILLRCWNETPAYVDANRESCYALGWTCADKKRILLTAEDGSKHCIRFNFAEKASLPSVEPSKSGCSNPRKPGSPVGGGFISYEVR